MDNSFSEIKIEIKQSQLSEDVTLINFKGNLDATQVAEIANCLNELIGKGKVQLIADLAEVNYVSSPALGELMGCKRRAKEQNGDLVLVGLNTDVKGNLNLMGANKIFSYFNDVRSAILNYTWKAKSRKG